MLIILIFTSETLNYTIMKAIIAIVCKESESINMFFFPLAISKKMKDYKDGAICFVEKDNLPDARYYLALDLIEEKHISKIDTDLIIVYITIEKYTIFQLKSIPVLIVCEDKKSYLNAG